MRFIKNLIGAVILLFCVIGTAFGQSVTVDFNNTTGTANPMAFGAQANLLSFSSSQLSTFNNLGVKLTRSNVWPGNIVPVTTAAEYNSKLSAGCPSGSVCDPNTWSWEPEMSEIEKARANGYPMIQVSLPGNNFVVGDRRCMSWIMNSSSGCNGEINQYGIWEDIIEKIVQHFPPDYLEVLNEPDGGNAGPFYSASDYTTVFSHTLHAVRAVSSTVKVIGPVTGDDNAIQFADALHVAGLTPDAISWHEYFGGFGVDPAGACTHVRGIWPGIPCFVTEWNWDAALTPENANGSHSASFVGSKFIWMLQGNIGGTLYSATLCSSSEPQTDPGCGFWNISSGTLFNKSYAWQMDSVKMGLGAGNITVKQATSSGLLAAGGFVNSAGKPVVLLANDGGAVTVPITMKNLANGTYNLTSYIVDYASNTGQTPLENIPVTVTGGQLIHNVNMTAGSALGLILSAGAPTPTPSPSPTPNGSFTVLIGN